MTVKGWFLSERLLREGTARHSQESERACRHTNFLKLALRKIKAPDDEARGFSILVEAGSLIIRCLAFAKPAESIIHTD